MNNSRELQAISNSSDEILGKILYLFSFFLTLNYRVDLGQGLPKFTILEYFCIFVLFLLMLMFLTDRKLYFSFLSDKKRTYLWLYIAFVFVSGVANLIYGRFNANYSIAILPGVLAYFLIANARTQKFIPKMLIYFFIGVFINLAIGYSQLFFDFPYFIELSQAADQKMDISGEVLNTKVIYGFYNHPNGYALAMMPAFLLGLGIFYCYRRKLFIGLLVTLIFISILFTYAKGVLFWSVGGIVYFGFINFYKISSLKKLNYISFLFVFLGIISVLIVSFYLSSDDNKGLRTVLWRIAMWVIALDISWQSYFNILFGGFTDQIRLESSLIFGMGYPNAHNGILNQIVFFGYPAFFSWLLFLSKSVSIINRGASNVLTGRSSQIVLISSLSLLGLFFFEPSIDSSVFQTQLYYFLGLGVSLSYSENRPSF